MTAVDPGQQLAHAIMLDNELRRNRARAARGAATVQLSLRQPRDLIDIVDRAAAAAGETLDQFVARALRAAVGAPS